jgi:DNA gyrase subunit A
VTRSGFGLRFALAAHTEVTTKAGRRYARPGDGDEVVGVIGVKDGDVVVTATSAGHVLHCKADEINKLEGPGKGVTVVKTGDDERVLGFVAGDKATTMVIENAAGKSWTLACDPREVTARGGKGHQLQKKTTFNRPPVPVTIPSLGPSAEGK